MKTPSDELFQLIKSMDTQEKVYFKKYTARTKSDNYSIAIFDAVNGTDLFDENKIKSKLKNKELVKNFNRYKNYTYDVILTSLERYHASSSIIAELSNSVQRIQVLLKKRLFDSAKKIIVRAEKLAIENSEYYYLAIILSLKREVMLGEVNIEELNNYPYVGYLNEINCIKILKNNIDYGKLSVQIGNEMYAHASIPDKKYIELKKVFKKDALLKDESQALSLPAKIKYYAILGDISYLLGDLEKSYIYYKKSVLLLEQNSFFLKNKPEYFLSRLGNFIRIIILLKRNEELIYLQNKVKHFVESLHRKLQSNNLVKIYIDIRINYIAYTLESFDIDSALKHSEEIAMSIKKYRNSQSFFVFHYNLFLIYFYLNDYHKALQQINKILNFKEPGINNDIVKFAKINNLIVHFELGNIELLSSLCKSAYRYFEKKAQLNKGEEIMLNFFGKIILKANTKIEKINVFTGLKRELELYKTEKIVTDFDIISWIESKIKNRPMLHILKEKAALKK